MRPVVVTTILTLNFLSACQPEPPANVLPPDEVLRSAARVSQQLESATYRATVEGRSRLNEFVYIEGRGTITGSLQRGGEQVQFMTQADITASDGDTEFAVRSTFEVLVAEPDEVYLRVESLEIEPQNTLLSQSTVDNVLGQWWLLPPAMQQGASPSQVSPDPRLLNAQAEVVAVTADRGLQTRRGRPMYFYDVRIDKEKWLKYLESATPPGEQFQRAEAEQFLQHTDLSGQIWIDAETFQIHALQWDIETQPTDAAQTETNVKITVELSDHNAADPITPPEDSEVFSPYNLVESALPFPSQTTSAPDFDIDTLSPAVREQFMQQLLDDSVPPQFSVP